MKKNLLILTFFMLFSSVANAKEIETNTAVLQAMDKVTGVVKKIEAPVGDTVKFRTFSIIVRACKTRPPEETPENFAFIDITEIKKNKDPKSVFRGWMLSSSPALSALEHEVYDVWLLSCKDNWF